MLRDKIRRNAARLLKAGETIEAVIPAFWRKPSRRSGGGRHLILIATDQRLMLCQSGVFSASAVKNLIAEFPRDTQIGPAHGHGGHEFPLPVPHLPPTIPAGFFSIWIAPRFYKDIAAADAARRGAATVW